MKNPPVKRNRKANRDGFSLVEMVVAVVVLTFGMLAMAASTGYMAAEIRNANWNTQRTMAREQVIEKLRAVPFDSVLTVSSQQAVGRYNMTWLVTSMGSNLKNVVVIANGPAYRPGKGALAMVTDSVVIRVARP